MKKAVLSLSILMALSSSVAFAKDTSNFYLGARVGASMLGGACDGPIAATESCGNETDFSGGVILGYDFENGIALEATYDYMGRFNASGYYDLAGVATPTGVAAGDLTSITLAPKFAYSITERSDIYAKVGAAWLNWNAGGSSKVGSDSKASVLAAIGYDFRASDLIGLRLEYQYIPEVKTSYFKADSHLLSAGITFHFGRHPIAPIVVEEPVPVVEEPAVVETVVEQQSFVLNSADETALFEFGKARLLDVTKQHLQPMLERLRQYPDATAIISGYTDTSGPEEFNLVLSKERAQSVANFFIENGIDASRLTVRGMGEADPVAPNDTQAGRMKNRRVTIDSPEFSFTEEVAVDSVEGQPVGVEVTEDVTEAVAE